MKRPVYLLVFLLCCTAWQTDAQDLRFEPLTLNSSPAFTILGVEPVNIQRPNTPSDFIGGVQSAIVNNELKPNFAMEVTPYFWFHPKGNEKASQDDSLRFDPLDYITHNNPLKSLTISLASSASDSFTFGDIQQGTGFGLGLHTTLFSEGLRRKTRLRMICLLQQEKEFDFMASIEARLMADPESTINLHDFLLDLNDRKDDQYKLSTENLVRLQELIGKVTLSAADLPYVHKMVQDILIETGATLSDINTVAFPLTKEGFSLDIAGAVCGIFQQNQWNRFQYAKTSLWLTPSYRWFNLNNLKQYFDVMAVVRVTFNDKLADVSNYIEAGIRGQATLNRWGISAEGVFRALSQKPEMVQENYSWRSDVSIDYKLSHTVTFKFTFGTNFDGNSTHFSDPKKMFALGGFNFGFGDLFGSTD